MMVLVLLPLSWSSAAGDANMCNSCGVHRAHLQRIKLKTGQIVCRAPGAELQGVTSTLLISPASLLLELA
jgi:hypothetical protein